MKQTLLGSSFACSLVLASLLVISCSDDEAPAAAGPPGSSPSGRTVRIEEIRSALRPVSDAQCAWLFRCCSTDERADRLGVTSSATECGDRLLDVAVRSSIPYTLAAAGDRSPASALLQELNRLSYGFDRGRIDVDAVAVQACVQQLAAAACTPLPTKDHCVPTPPPPADDPCTVEKLLIGKQQLGADCTPNSTDCAPGLLCSSLHGVDGVCIKAAQVGDVCFDDSDCQSKLVCDYRTGKCVQGGDTGAACTYADPARPKEGTVAERCREGLACDTISFKCVSPSCSGGSYCSTDQMCPTDMTCVRGQCGRPLKVNELCYQDKDCETKKCRYHDGRSVCGALAAAGGVCNDASDCATGWCKYSDVGSTCAAQQAEGAPCLSGSDQECTTGRCRFGATAFACAPPAVVGAACVDDQGCSPAKKLFCVDLTCESAPFANGAPCDRDTSCQSERCFAGRCIAKPGAGADCGKSELPPCDTGFYCNSLPGTPGKCVAKKASGARCETELECWGSCRASFGVLRCGGTGPSESSCSGPR